MGPVRYRLAVFAFVGWRENRTRAVHAGGGRVPEHQEFDDGGFGHCAIAASSSEATLPRT